MKKIFVSVLMVFTIMSTICVIATEESLDITQTAPENQIIEIDNFEDYEALFSEQEQEQISDEEYDKIYEEQMTSLAEYYDALEMPELFKAKVITTKEPTYVYENDYTGFVYKMKVQEVEVEIMDGEYVGERVSVTYPLTADTFLNMDIPNLNKGDVIYVTAGVDEETQKLYAEANGTGFNVERKTGAVILAVVAIILMVAFGKNRGVLSTLIMILILSITLLICSEQIYLGTSIIELTLFLSILIVAMIVIQKMGLTKEAILVGISSIIGILVITFVTFIVDSLLKNTGATFDAMVMIENIIKRNIDFHHMFIGSIILIVSAILPYVACDVWQKCEKTNQKDFNSLLDASKDALTGKVEIITIIFMTFLMPKLVYLHSYKYTANEIINSDVVITEFIRLFMCIIAMAITIPITSGMYRCFKKQDNDLKDNK